MYEPTKKDLDYFAIDSVDGELILNKPFPKRMSQKRALELSIAKWHLMVENKLTYDGEAYTCALCQRNDDCLRCPVGGCAGTPYGWDRGMRRNRAELKFLQDLHTELYG